MREIKCSVCGVTAESLGQVPIRTHGSGAAAKLFFGQWAEIGEKQLPVDLYRCPKCGKLEMYDLDFSMSRQ